MKTRVIMILLSLFVMAPGWAKVVEKTPAFPGAEGFGRYTTGGRGGEVYHVTSLEDDGETGTPGTFRYAVKQKGVRTIVFDVAGTIHLKSPLSIQSGNVTIAGQTAPGDGVCIADFPFSIKADNVIVRYMHFRLGSNYSGDDGDGLGGMDKKNIIVDHCSVSWSVDECLSVYGCENLTVQWCLVAQSLVDAGHSKGAHGYGGNWGGKGASYHHNLLAHHGSRTPRLGPRYTTQLDERMDYRNNVIYNWAGNGCYGGEGMKVNIVNNYYKPGPATATRNDLVQRRIASVGVRTKEYVTTYPAFEPSLHLWGKFYVAGNVNTKFDDVTKDNWGKGFVNQIDKTSCDGTFTSVTADTIKLDAPIDFIHVTNHTANVAYEKVVQYAGCCKSYDPYDQLILSDVKAGTANAGTGTGNTAGMINKQTDVKYLSDADHDASFFPVLKSGAAQKDSDGDGMPDEWETANGLNPNDASDGKTAGKDGYTNLENYLNSLVADITAAQLADGEVVGQEQTIEMPEEGEVTYLYFEGVKGNKITFANKFTLQITGKLDKEISGGNAITVDNGESYTGMKVSNGAQNTLTLPQGCLATKATFFSYVNKAASEMESARTSYWKEVAGIDYDGPVMVCPNEKPVETPDVNSYTLPQVNSFTFTNVGEQTVYVLRVEYFDPSSAIKSVSASPAQSNAVYNLAGQMVGNGYKGIVVKNGKRIASH